MSSSVSSALAAQMYKTVFELLQCTQHDICFQVNYTFWFPLHLLFQHLIGEQCDVDREENTLISFQRFKHSPLLVINLLNHCEYQLKLPLFSMYIIAPPFLMLDVMMQTCKSVPSCVLFLSMSEFKETGSVARNTHKETMGWILEARKLRHLFPYSLSCERYVFLWGKNVGQKCPKEAFNSYPQPAHHYLSWAAVCTSFSLGLWSFGIQVLGSGKTHDTLGGMRHKGLRVKWSLYT